MCEKCDALKAQLGNPTPKQLVEMTKQALTTFVDVKTDVVVVTGIHKQTGQTKELPMVDAEAFNKAKKRLETLAEKVIEVLESQVIMNSIIDAQLDTLAELSAIITMNGDEEMKESLSKAYASHLEAVRKIHEEDGGEDEDLAEVISQALYQNSDLPPELKEALNKIFVQGNGTVH